MLDRDDTTYWTTDDGVTTAELVIRLGRSEEVSMVRLEEGIALGQRIEAFSVDVDTQDGWREAASATTIGPRRILRFPTVTTDRIRIRITRSAAPPVLTAVEVY